MSKAGHRRLGSLFRCPECGKGFGSLAFLRSHAKQTECDISAIEAEIRRAARSVLKSLEP